MAGGEVVIPLDASDLQEIEKFKDNAICTLSALADILNNCGNSMLCGDGEIEAGTLMYLGEQLDSFTESFSIFFDGHFRRNKG